MTTQRDNESPVVPLVGYFKAHARRVYGAANERGDGGRLGAALRWIRKHGGETTARKLRMYGVGGVRSALEAEGLLADLAAHGHGALTPEARGSLAFGWAPRRRSKGVTDDPEPKPHPQRPGASPRGRPAGGGVLTSGPWSPFTPSGRAGGARGTRPPDERTPCPPAGG